MPPLGREFNPDERNNYKDWDQLGQDIRITAHETDDKYGATPGTVGDCSATKSGITTAIVRSTL